MRYTLEIPDKIAEILKNIATEKEISMAELMRRALMTYAVLTKEISKGKSVCLTIEGKIEKELVLIQ